MTDETRDENEGVQTAEPNGAELPDDGADAETEASVVSDEIAALQGLLADASGKYVRLAADFDNYRRRMERSRADMVTQAQTSLIRRLLDVLDDLERVAHHADPKASAQALAEGVGMVERKFRTALESAGVEEVPAENARFDPQTMEAVASVPAEDPKQDDTVSDVFQKGYRINGMLIRPARVRVRKHE